MYARGDETQAWMWKCVAVDIGGVVVGVTLEMRGCVCKTWRGREWNMSSE